MMATASTDLFPRPFGEYTLLAKMPDGGMGALYLGCRGDVGLEKLCVIKTVLPRADKEYRARFRDEAKVVVRLSHGNLVPVFDAGVVGDELYLAMEYVDGKDLRSVWNRCAQKGIAFPVEVAVYIAREISRGLHHAHTHESIKLVHRDVSPPNVLVSFFGEVKLTDFGLASSTLKTEKTQAGVVYGKISRYMSPEQAKGEPLDGRTDQYAVAVMLWELLTGRQLFSSKDADVVQRVREPEVLPPSQVAPRVDPALDVIVCKALAKERTLRYADCEAFRSALSGYLAQTAPTLDNAGVSEFLQRLFGDEITEQRKERQRMLAELSGRVKALHNADPTGAQDASQPNTVDLSPPDHSHGHLIGTLLDGRYLVKRLIGEGGMGVVYEAEHVDIGRRVAVKVLHAAFTRHAEVVSRFRSEARAATRIGHPHIIDVFDSGTTVDGAVYFVMEFLDGKDLGELVRQEKTLPVRRSIAIAREICQALAAAHKAGIIHRDMKPENVFLVDRDGQKDFVKVLDFGIAKTVEGITDRVGRLTTPGMAMGTPEYMAPEQAAGQQADPRVDVYAVGAILYEMLTGRPPHEGATIIEVLTKKATEAPTPIENLRPDVPRELARLTMRALALLPEERPQSMDKLAEELGRLSGSGAVPVPFSPAGMRTHTIDAVGPAGCWVPATVLVVGATAVGARQGAVDAPRSVGASGAAAQRDHRHQAGDDQNRPAAHATCAGRRDARRRRGAHRRRQAGATRQAGHPARCRPRASQRRRQGQPRRPQARHHRGARGARRRRLQTGQGAVRRGRSKRRPPRGRQAGAERSRLRVVELLRGGGVGRARGQSRCRRTRQEAPRQQLLSTAPLRRRHPAIQERVGEQRQ